MATIRSYLQTSNPPLAHIVLRRGTKELSWILTAVLCHLCVQCTPVCSYFWYMCSRSGLCVLQTDSLCIPDPCSCQGTRLGRLKDYKAYFLKKTIAIKVIFWFSNQPSKDDVVFIVKKCLRRLKPEDVTS